MKSTKALIMALPLVAAIAFSTPGYALFDKEVKMKWADVPAAVQETINAHSDGGKISEVEKATEDKTSVYEAKVDAGGEGKLKIKVEEGGKLIGLRYKDKGETDVKWSSVPAAVQKTISAYAGGKAIDKVERDTRRGRSIYEAKVKNDDGQTVKMKVSDDGKLRELDTGMDWF